MGRYWRLSSDNVENIFQTGSRSLFSSGRRVTTVPSFNVIFLGFNQNGSVAI
ncbi:hypothetical protein KAT55_05520 [Candidatus Bathyarchaeota archaeon]|nr:hypothetical protein [Candidatus Bathyarchaeota archaeon]